MANLDYPEGSGPLCSRQAKKKWIIGGSIGVVSLIILIVIIVEATKGGKEPPKKGSWILLNVPLIDGHNELAAKLKEHYENNITNYDFRKNLLNNTNKIQTDYPRLNMGQVGTVVWVVSAPCESQYRDAVALTLEQIDVMKRFFRNYTDLLEPFTMSPNIWTSFTNKKMGSILALSGGHSIDSRLSVLRMYYQLGVRYMSLAKECNTPWVGGNIQNYNNFTGTKTILTGWGKVVIKEMNRLGMIIDLSGTYHEAMLEVLKVTKAPVILSSTAAFGIKSHEKNVKDEVLDKLKINKGLVMLSFDAELLSNDDKCDVNNVIEHIEYIVDKTSIDNIAIGANFDGMKSPCNELNDVSQYYKIFDELYAKNKTRWSFANLEKLATRNFERVFIDVETYKIKHINDLPNIESMPPKELENAYTDETKKCRLELTKP